MASSCPRCKQWTRYGPICEDCLGKLDADLENLLCAVETAEQEGEYEELFAVYDTLRKRYPREIDGE